MSRAPWFAILAFALSLGVAQAGPEEDLLKKFRNHNQSAADKLKEEATRLANQGTSVAQMYNVLGKLQDDVSLPREERTNLIRKLQDRVRQYAGTAADKTTVQAAPAVGATTQFRPTFLGLTTQGTISVPDGGAAVLASSSSSAEGRNEAGVPGVGKLPIAGRGFRNVGAGRSVSGTQLSISVRIISLQEEDARILGKK